MGNKVIPLKEKVITDAMTRRQRRLQYHGELYRETYDKPRNYEFPPIEKINMNQHFYFPKFSRGFSMSLPAMAMYPVLCLQADFEQNKWFQISQRNIATMAGVSINTVVNGIRDLEQYKLGGQPFLEKKKKTEGQRHFYVYRVNFTRKDDMKDWKNNFFIFHKCIIDSKVWAQLTSRAKGLYLSMRMSARFDPESYIELEGLDVDWSNWSDLYQAEEYRNRKWDLCMPPSLAELCRHVGIEPINLRPVLEQLEYYRLVELADGYLKVFKVYLRPRIRGDR